MTCLSVLRVGSPVIGIMFGRIFILYFCYECSVKLLNASSLDGSLSFILFCVIYNFLSSYFVALYYLFVPCMIL